MSVRCDVKREGGPQILSFSYPVPGRVLGSFFNCSINPHNSPARKTEVDEYILAHRASQMADPGVIVLFM